MKTPGLALLAALVTLTLVGEAEARGRRPGSKLIFPVHRSGPEWFTVLTVTNTNTQPANQVQLGGTTFVHFEYYNTVPDDDDPCLTKSCSVHNDTEVLTPADTLSLLTTCHNAESPGGNEGFVLVSAQDPSAFDQDWRFDFLVGSELVVNGSGGVYSINAVPIGATGSEGEPSPVGPGFGPPFEYPPFELYGDAFVARARSNLSLTAFMEDPGDRSLLHFRAWNDNEQPMSATKWMGCWFDRRLEHVAPMFGEAHLLGTGHDPAELDLNCNGVGQLETGWFVVRIIASETPSGTPIDIEAVPIVGALTAGVSSTIDGGRLLWESTNAP